MLNQRLPTISKLVLLGICVFLSACSTRKNTFFNRNYHNLTAYYNIYWNGNETYKELLEQVKSFDYDNYSHVLNVFEYGSIEDTAATNAKTDRMLEKASKAIGKHSMNIRGVEYVFVMKDAYMMVGKAHFYKHNYSMARVGFNFVINQYPKDPQRFEAQLWAARTYIQEGEFDMAAPLLAQVRSQEKNLHKTTFRDLPLIMAQYYISQENYESAIGFLKEGINRVKERDLRNRLHFILGQIYQKQMNLRDAFNHYQYVTRHNAPLELDYNARLNMALCFDRNYANLNEVMKNLNRLLKDEKNSKYFGRIYYVLANIALQERNTPQAINYLRKSVDYAASDKEQIAMSAVKLADLYFDLTEYENAQPFYVMAQNVMTEDHPDYFRVEVRAENLGKLIQYIEIIRKEEMGMNLLGLSEPKRDAMIDTLIKAYTTKNAAKTADAKTPTAGLNTPQSDWYFYNSRAKEFGQTEFVRKWGHRSLEDYWFLQEKPNMFNRQSIQDDEKEEEEIPLSEKEASDVKNPGNKAYYLALIPKNDDEIIQAQNRHEEALFRLGAGYFDLLEETKQGITTLEKLLDYYPESPYRLQVYYYLYRMNMVDNNEAGKKKYRDLLVQHFPDSEQTRMVTDPNFAKTRENNAEKAHQLYEYTFIAYINGNYDAVLANVEEGHRKYPANAQTPKFRFLHAMATGSKEGSPAIIKNLEKFMVEFPSETTLIELAQSIIEFHKNSKLLSAQDVLAAQAEDNTLKNQALRLSDVDTAKTQSKYDVSMYKANPAMPHYALVFIKKNVNADVIKIKISDFNRKNYAADKFIIDGMPFDETYYLIYISTMRTSSIAQGYIEELLQSNYVFGTVEALDKEVLIISAENFRSFLKQRNKDAYNHFYKGNY